MSAIKIDRGQGQNPWLLHASTIEEVDEHLADTYRQIDVLCRAESNADTLHEIDVVRDLRDRLLDLRNELRALRGAA